MAKRVKKTVLSGITQEEALDAFARYAEADAQTALINASMDEAFTRIREGFQSELQLHKDTMDKAFDTIQAYATENKDILFSKKKSVETPHGLFGFRTGTPKLKTSKGTTWSKVTEKLKELLPDFTRVIVEPAKDALLASRDLKEVNQLFPEIGVYVDQEETFYIECKKESPLA